MLKLFCVHRLKINYPDNLIIMQIVVYFYQTRDEFNRCMDIVKSTGTIIEQMEDEDKDDKQFIYVKYNSQVYSFNRFDLKFINKVKKCICENPYKWCPGINWEGCFHLYKIDERFTDPKYYTIEREENGNENMLINNEMIINDLYDGTYNRHK